MHKTGLLFLISFCFFCEVFPQKPAEKYLHNRSNTYDEAIRFYKELDEKFSNAVLLTYGLTDCGRPLHAFVLSKDSALNPASAKDSGKAVVLINNAIHAGEPDGIDASMKYAEDLLTGREPIPQNVVICIIPVYNIDGALNRGCCSRANQNGPEEYGFRGNYQNLDLNRDFIKCDALNTQVFHALFREWDPDVLIDTHVSNGADYAYTMTVIVTQHDKLEKAAGTYLSKKMTPAIFDSMKKKGSEMSPYVNTWEEAPDNGLIEFLETPRFATGYAALFHTFGFVTESHMLKPFKERVEATYDLISSIVNYTDEHKNEITGIRNVSRRITANQKIFPLEWHLDTLVFDSILFKGFAARYKQSKVTGLQQLYYDRASPYEKKIRFYNRYKPGTQVEKPWAYVIPQSWREVVTHYRNNKIQMQRLEKDTALQCEVYYIGDFETTSQPYEGHYLHSDVKVRKETQSVNFFKGDYIVITNQPENRFIVETLEPQATDSYFAWGFFDAILQQKEYFSAYVFDTTAERMLAEDPDLRDRFEAKKGSDPAFARDIWAQLAFLYRTSPLHEKSYRRYPVARLVSATSLPLQK